MQIFKVERMIKNTTKKNFVIKILIASIFSLTIFLSAKMFTIYKMFNDSMHPKIKKGQYMLTLKTNKFDKGDLVVVKNEDGFLVKRVIGGPGDKVDFDKSGNVFINDKFLEEPYAFNKNVLPGDMKFPYQVPNNSYFLLGDNRSQSIDSRVKKLAGVSKGKIVEKVIFLFCPWK